MKYNFIKVSDPETKAKLIQLGFSILSESNGVTTFVNKYSAGLIFDKDKVAYTNKLEM